MGVITAKGKDAKESVNKKNGAIDFKKVFIRLKDGESVRVRLLSPEDYVEYRAHGLYQQGIYTQPCIEPTGQPCAHCEAAKAGVEAFELLRARKRYLFAMADIDEGILRVFDASQGQAHGIIQTIEQYQEDLGELAFVFKRTGTKVDTSFTLNPIIKLKADDREKFKRFDNGVVEEDFYEKVLQPRTRQQQIEELEKAGFPVEQYFANEIPDAGVKPIDELPF
ncbi:hypothetical protein [Heliophilum fasciatum]|uniref:Bacteriophage T4 Gp32 single-stranded DNA-binding domain-containing protein n=1 Tax=Heliophilum fasciatum TaxID=35700 RepID=A0A4R2REY5_9FIRM|nr:hypothetical protein [Heliophilum fasciatum]MCW2279253.1 hypothetical protein [Heliophilum fasciatum]TCP60617.1 hypothetical protein EDD73_1355 [Heliophilum fasciatum]